MFLWQSRKITSVLGAVSPAVVLEFCISDRHLKIDNRRIPKREAVATSAVYQMSPPRGGLIYERATAKVFQYVGRAKKKAPRCVVGLFPPPLRDDFSSDRRCKYTAILEKSSKKAKKIAGLQPCNPAINGVFEEKNCDFWKFLQVFEKKNCDFWKFLQVFGKGINFPCLVNR